MNEYVNLTFIFDIPVGNIENVYKTVKVIVLVPCKIHMCVTYFPKKLDSHLLEENRNLTFGRYMKIYEIMQ